MHEIPSAFRINPYEGWACASEPLVDCESSIIWVRDSATTNRCRELRNPNTTRIDRYLKAARLNWGSAIFDQIDDEPPLTATYSCGFYPVFPWSLKPQSTANNWDSWPIVDPRSFVSSCSCGKSVTPWFKRRRDQCYDVNIVLSPRCEGVSGR